MMMVLSLIGIMIPLVALVLLGIVVSWIVRLHLWANVYRDLARRYGGWVERRWLLPVLRTQFRGTECRLYSTWRGPGRIGATTVVRLPWSQKRQQLILGPPSLSSEIPWRKFGQNGKGQLLVLDPGLLAASNDVPWALTALEGEASRTIAGLMAGDCHRSPAWLTIERGRWKFHRVGALRQRADLERLLREAWRVYDTLAFGVVPGIDFVPKPLRSDSPSAQCPVCNQRLCPEPVWCASCHTPHCHDCWEYNGGCAVFACGEKCVQLEEAVSPSPRG